MKKKLKLYHKVEKSCIDQVLVCSLWGYCRHASSKLTGGDLWAYRGVICYKDLHRLLDHGSFDLKLEDLDENKWGVAGMEQICRQQQISCSAVPAYAPVAFIYFERIKVQYFASCGGRRVWGCVLG